MREINAQPKAILLEPMGKNTAPAIALAALKAIEKNHDPTLLVLSSDHKIDDEEKFRKVIEAYQKEADYGKTIENYPGYITLNNNQVAVDFFRLGRLGLFYRTPDGNETGFWNLESNNWLHEGSSLDTNIKAALDISNRQSPPNFITLPLKPIE